jgi:hypothetical protein
MKVKSEEELHALLPSAYEDDDLFGSDSDIGSVTNALQKLVMIADTYVKLVPLLTTLPKKTKQRYYQDYCPVLICLIHCHNKDLVQFRKRWGNKFRHNTFRTKCCPGSRRERVIANSAGLSRCGEHDLQYYTGKLSELSNAVNLDLGGVRTYSQLCHFLVCPKIPQQLHHSI